MWMRSRGAGENGTGEGAGLGGRLVGRGERGEGGGEKECEGVSRVRATFLVDEGNRWWLRSSYRGRGTGHVTPSHVLILGIKGKKCRIEFGKS